MKTLEWLVKRTQLTGREGLIDFEAIASAGGEELLKAMVERISPLVLSELSAKYDELSKADPPPMKHGEQHPTKPLIGVKHPTGGLMWHKNPAAAAADDKEVVDKTDAFVARFPAEHQAMVRQFLGTVGGKHTRHFIPAEDRAGGVGGMRPSIRQRHIVQLLRGNPIASLHVSSPGVLSFTLRERHGEKNPGPYTWNFDGRFFEKKPDGTRAYW